MKSTALLLLLVFVLVSACDRHEPLPTAVAGGEQADSFSKDAFRSTEEDLALFAKTTALVDRINEGLAAQGNDLRLEYPWLFRIGWGVDPWGRLRTGSRWANPRAVSYVLDASDYTSDVIPVDVETALLRAFETWNDIPNSVVNAGRIPDSGANFDVLDAVVLDSEGNCVDIIDTTSPNLLAYDPSTGELNILIEADIVFGGWLGPAYFEKCFGDPTILGITWSFALPDLNGDGYWDRVYVEEFYNDAYDWVTGGSIFLDQSTGIDIETIVLHENGHAHGLGHFGGPIVPQQYTLKPNLRVFNPEAVMNPFYLGGEKRDPYPTDEAGILTMYGRKGR